MLWLFPFLLSAVLEQLVNTGRLKGTVVGGRQDKAVFIPDIYARTQSNWVDSFFKQNGYLGNFFWTKIPFQKLLIQHNNDYPR